MSDEAEEQFITEGIRRYAQALETIRAFETMLGDRLLEVAKGYSSPRFVPSKSPMNKGTSDGAFGHVVWASQEGTLKGRKENVWLELGIWWCDDEVALYCGFADDDNKAVPFEYTRNHPRIEFKKWSRKARLFMVVSSNPAVGLDAEFKIILDELMGSFK
jgi:hypothetical protein